MGLASKSTLFILTIKLTIMTDGTHTSTFFFLPSSLSLAFQQTPLVHETETGELRPPARFTPRRTPARAPGELAPGRLCLALHGGSLRGDIDVGVASYCSMVDAVCGLQGAVRRWEEEAGRAVSAGQGGFTRQRQRREPRDRKSTRLNSSHKTESRMPSSA